MAKIFFLSIIGALVGFFFPVIITYILETYMGGTGNEVDPVLFYSLIFTTGLLGGMIGALTGDAMSKKK